MAKENYCNCENVNPSDFGIGECLAGIPSYRDKEMYTDGEFCYSDNEKFAKIVKVESFGDLEKTPVICMHCEDIETHESFFMTYQKNDNKELTELLKTNFKIE